MSAAMKLPFKYLMSDTDRRQTLRYYVRLKIGGKNRKIRVKAEPGTMAFQKAYDAALEKLQKIERSAVTAGPAGAGKNSLEWLGRKYMMSTKFRNGLDPVTQRARENILIAVFAEIVEEGSPVTYGQCPALRFTSKMVKDLRDRKGAAPHAANSRLKALRNMLKWAVEAETLKGLDKNVAAGVANVETRPGGHHSWTADEVRQFIARHPLGSKPYLAMALMLFTGARKSDAIEFGRQHVKNGWLKFTPIKTRNSTRKELTLPVLPQLEEAIARAETGDLTYLVTEYGVGFTPAGFGNWFRARCDEAGLPNCTAHGLRKAGATIAAENGATERELMAIFGWESPELAAYYTKSADQKRLAGGAMNLITLEPPKHEDGTSSAPLGKRGALRGTLRRK